MHVTDLLSTDKGIPTTMQAEHEWAVCEAQPKLE